MRRIWALEWTLLAAFLVAPAAHAWTVTYNPSGWTTNLTDTANDEILEPPVQSVIFPSSFPVTATTPGVTAGASAAVMDYDFSNDGFSVAFDEQVPLAMGSGTQGMAYIYFKVDENVEYLISGSFIAVDTEGRRVRLWTFLEDITSFPFFLFESKQVSETTPNESFTVGSSDGDASNELSGSSTGTLLAGHSYRFFAEASLEGYPYIPRTTGAVGTGNLSISFSPEASEVPSLSTVSVVILCSVLGLVGVRKFRA